MVVSTARVATERPAALLEQLCEHFAHESGRHFGQEISVSFDDHQGFVDFAPFMSGTLRFEALARGVLVVEVSGADAAAFQRVQRVLTEHVERLGASEGLTVEWGPGVIRR